MTLKRGERRAIGRGIYEDASGITARVTKGRHPHLLMLEQRYARGTDLGEIRAWQIQAAAQLATRAQVGATRGTLAKDVETYLASAQITKLCRKRRTQQLAWWVERFGHRRRVTIKAPEISRALNELTNQKTGGPASASTRNAYRTALFHLWTVLDGKDAPNPVRDVAPRREPAALPRGLDYQVIDTILEQARLKCGQRSLKTVARLRVFAYAPVTPAQLMKLEPSDVDFTGATVLVHGRNKGAGAPPARKPLLPMAVEAFRAFDAAHAWGPFSVSSLRKAFIRARDAAETLLRQVDPPPRVDLSTVRLYDLRHSFGSLIFAATGSLSVTGEMMDHSNAQTTRRYALAAVPAHLSAAMEAARKLLPTPAPTPPARAPLKIVARG